MKKSMLVVILILSFMLIGCSNKKEVDKEQEIVEIEYWYGLGGKLGEAMETIIQDFNSSQDKVKVVGIKQSNYEETMKMIQASVAAQKVPACCLLDMTYTKSFANKNLLEPLDSYIERDKEFKLDDILNVLLLYGKNENGELCAIPAYGSTHFFYYRNDVFQELNLDPDEVFKSWQTLAEASKLIKERKGIYGADPMYDWHHFIDIAVAAGGSVLSSDKTKITFDSEEWICVMESLRKWIHEDEIMKINFGGEGWESWYKTVDDVLQGRTAAYIGASADISDLDFDIVSAHVQPGWEDNPAKPFVVAVMNQIMKDAPKEEKEAAYEWIAYFSRADVNAKFCMLSGYVPVRNSCMEIDEYKKFLEKTPAMKVAFDQMKIGTTCFIDPTGGKIKQALVDAIDLILIENVPAEQALTEMKEVAQKDLDEYLSNAN